MLLDSPHAMAMRASSSNGIIAPLQQKKGTVPLCYPPFVVQQELVYFLLRATDILHDPLASRSIVTGRASWVLQERRGALSWLNVVTGLIPASGTQWSTAYCACVRRREFRMTVKRHHKPGVPGKQRRQRPPVATMATSADRPTLNEQSETEQHLAESSERQHLADKLWASEQRFRITFEQAPVGMAHVGLDGRWLLVNQKLCALLGYTQEELLERTFHAVMLPEDLSITFAHAQSMIAGDLQTYLQELRFVCKDGSQIWVNLTVTLVRDNAGMPLSFLAVMEDLTDRKQAAQQRRLNQLKDQFIVNVNHELRTPLTEVYGYLELLSAYQGHLDFETQAQFLVRAKEGCQELILLINHVLDAQAVTEEGKPPQCEVLAVAPLVRDVLEHLDPQQEEADRLHLALPEQLTVWANGQLLRQVLRNVLSNAFKYCPKPVAVIIYATQIDPGAQGTGSAPQVCLCVQDAGPGIPPEELPLLFQKFVRLQRDLSGTVRGSGLGLYISKQFVEAMQGRMWAESAGITGQGSKFYVTLPCHPQVLDDGHGAKHMLSA